MFSGARDLFALDPHVAHLNHGSFGALPHVVRDAWRHALDEYDANPTGLVTGSLWPRVTQARHLAATFLGADPDLCALVLNATSGMAVVLNSLDFATGDEVVITDHSYHAVTLAAHDLIRRFGVKVIVAPVDLDSTPERTVSAITDRVGDRTKLVIVDEISSATAQWHPTAALAEALRERGVPLLVDAAHSPGMLHQPLSDVDPDFWVGNLHKWAFAPGGTAILRVTPAWRDKLVPFVVSHAQRDGFPANIEQQGTRDYAPWLTMSTALSFFEQIGETESRQHNAALAAYGQQVIGEALGLEPSHLPDPGHNISMRVIPLPDGLITDHDAALRLRAHIARELATEVAVNLWRDQALLRVSAQIYNTPAEYDRLATHLPALLNHYEPSPH